MNTCGTCKYRDESGYCANPKLAEGNEYTHPAAEREVMLLCPDLAGCGIKVGANFGCVHHELKAP